ncbi:MAG TPA: thrombospondin type 3 repeat-containing protein [Phycisphaerae bacterium]|nr:thrombospondin type 3 repeat-containing protein [Phycisphaerae bacterium]
MYINSLTQARTAVVAWENTVPRSGGSLMDATTTLLNSMIQEMKSALDTCPGDPNKLRPGSCGCGLPDFDPSGLLYDSDTDGINDACDNCPLVHNPGREDLDGDWEGNVCDADMDGDGYCNESDNCPMNANADQTDSDNDEVGDACDACPRTIPEIVVDGSGCPPLMVADFDRDGDVDLEDFARLQSCLSGTNVAQDNTACQNTKLDGDTDVDLVDLSILLGCMGGSHTPGGCLAP